MYDFAVNFIAILVLPFAWAEYGWKELRTWVIIKFRRSALDWRLRGKSKDDGEMVKLRLLRRSLRKVPGTTSMYEVVCIVDAEIERRKVERNWRVGVR